MRPLATDLAALCALFLAAGAVYAYGPRFCLWLRAELRHRADLARVTGGGRRG